MLDIDNFDILDSTQAEAINLRLTIKDVIEFANRISTNTPKGAQAIIDYVSLNFDAETNTIKDIEDLKKNGRASFLSANNMVRLINVIEAFRVGENSKPNEAADHIVTMLLENEDVKIYQISGAIPELLDSFNRSNYIYEIFNSRYWDNSRHELSKYNDGFIFSLRSSIDDILMLADRMKAETPKGSAEIIKSMKDPILRNINIQHSTINQVVSINAEQSPIFNKTSTTYPPELDLAIKAWQAVSSSEGKGKPKARIKEWLDNNTKNISNEAKKRIAIVANWEKTGGATPTD